MPLYEYECTQCHEEFEKLVRLSEAETKQECPKCHGKRTRRRLSKVAAKTNGSSNSVSTCQPGSRFS